MTIPPSIRVGDNNVWAFARAGGGVVLVDGGWAADGDQDASWALLAAQLQAQGHAPGDVREVVVTHEHIDHAGFAARWLRAGARVIVGGAGIATVEAGRPGLEAARAARVREYARQGCPPEVLETLASRLGRVAPWEPCEAGALTAAESCAPIDLDPAYGGGRLRLIAAPGHTPGNLVALIEGGALDGTLCSGDTLLPTTIPTTGLHFPGVERDPDAARWPSLPAAVRSVAMLGTLPLRRILPGHGEVVDDPARLVAQFAAHHARRGERVREALASSARASDGATAFEVTRAVFPRLPAARLGQALTEVVGHLDLLTERGQARTAVTRAAVHWHVA